MIKIALLADIHANYPALLAIAEKVATWGPDEVFVLGDSINRGPRPRACLQFLLEKQRDEGWWMIRGNHEEYVLKFEKPGTPRSGPEYEILRFVHWTHQKLAPGEISSLKELPAQIDRNLATGHHLRAVHASMAGSRAGIYPSTPQNKLPEMIHPPPDVLCVGHTHNPLIRRARGTKIINAGSVGLPFDHDPRACYVQLRLSHREVKAAFRRVTYDRERAIQDFHRTGFLSEGGPMVRIILRELRTARPLISRWHQEYERVVLEGKLTLEKSVERFLEDVPRSHHR